MPLESSRGFAGVDSDGTVTFDAAITSMRCALSGGPLSEIDHRTLDAFSAQVSIQELDPDGGSGYSFMIAECTEWGAH